MTYQEAAQRIKEGNMTDLTCADIWLLMRDHIIKNINIYGDIYEINILPIEGQNTYKYIPIPNECSITCWIKTVRKVYKTWKYTGAAYVTIHNENYEVIFDVLETKE